MDPYGAKPVIGDEINDGDKARNEFRNPDVGKSTLVKSTKKIKFSIEQWTKVILTLELDSEDNQDCQKIPLIFDSTDHYERIFMPLILLELKEKIRSASTLRDAKKHSSTFSVSKGDSKNLVVLRQPYNVDTRYLHKNDLILFTASNNATLLGKVERCEQSTTQGNYTVRLEETNVEILLKQRHWNVSCILNLTTDIREVEALLWIRKQPDPMQGLILKKKLGSDIKPSNMDSLSRELQKSLKSKYNQSQLKAIGVAIGDSRIALIQGPPGTGKTRTILGVISGLFAAAKSPITRVLVTSQSNVAVDDIISRIHTSKVFDKVGKEWEPVMVRFGKNSNAEHSERFCLDTLVDDAQKKYRTISRSDMERSFLRRARIVAATLSGCGGDQMHRAFANESDANRRPSEDNMFDVVIVDEAAQASELSTLIPLKLLKSTGKLIMVGDPKQLPPTVISSAAIAFSFQRSLFERLEQRGHHVEMLSTQYRMHPDISCFPSRHFYDEKLLDGVDKSSKAAPFHSKPLFRPYIFFDVRDGQEKTDGSSYRNYQEVEAAMELIRFFKNYFSENIGIITPYKGQVELLNSRVVEAFGSKAAVEVNTVDAFQGRESDIVVLSTVRASSSQEIGFLADLRRMNVALTRAKHSLWIFGNSQTLQRNADWGALLTDARKRRCIVPVDKFSDGELRFDISGGSGKQKYVNSSGRPRFETVYQRKVKKTKE